MAATHAQHLWVRFEKQYNKLRGTVAVNNRPMTLPMFSQLKENLQMTDEG
jgi:hypothetical protein